MQKHNTTHTHSLSDDGRQMRNVYAFKLILFSSFHVELSFIRSFVRSFYRWMSSSQSSFVCQRNFPDILPYMFTVYNMCVCIMHQKFTSLWRENPYSKWNIRLPDRLNRILANEIHTRKYYTL